MAMSTITEGLGRRLDLAVTVGAVTLEALAVSVMQAVKHAAHPLFNVVGAAPGEQRANDDAPSDDYS
jgi:hypothetical protein